MRQKNSSILRGSYSNMKRRHAERSENLAVCRQTADSSTSLRSARNDKGMEERASRAFAVWLPVLCTCGIALLLPALAAAQQAPLDVPCAISTVGAPAATDTQPAPLDPLAASPSEMKANTGDSNLIATPTLTPGTAFLFGLEKKFAAAVAERGGAGFASFFDKDGVTLGNRTAAALGQAAIAKQAQWQPQDYQLTWTPEGGELAPAGDMGFTWGHYEGHAKNAAATRGRYMTIWKKEADGTWKVVLDSSNDDAPDAANCNCKVGEKK